MEPSSSNTKTILIFWEMELSISKIRKVFLFREMELSELIFPQKKAFLIFRETEIPRKFLIFQETELSYISGNRNPKKFQEVTFPAQKIKKPSYISGNGIF